MLVLGFQGSPRRRGNTQVLLSAFMEAARNHGARTEVIEVDRRHILPCKEYIVCEKKGYCPIEDDMNAIYPLMREAEIVVAATPVFFYNCTAQLKALIDRSQTLWARRYKLGLKDPGHATRRGVLLAVGATKGKSLFEGLHLTARYFFDALAARYEGGLTYPGIEHAGDMAKHPTYRDEVAEWVAGLLGHYRGRTPVVFACRENACRSQMAAAFAQTLAGDRLDVSCGGSEPAEAVNPKMAQVMAEKGIDMGFRNPKAISDAIEAGPPPEVIVTMGCGEACPAVPGAQVIDWDLPDPAEGDLDLMRRIRDEIESRVTAWIGSLDF